jgi:hypothetical protein
VAGSAELRLFREFVSAPVPLPVTAEGKALAALRLSMGAAPAGTAYHQAWSGVRPESVSVDGSTITVRLSSGSNDRAALTTQQLVWTVQAALGKSLPVRFQLADGSADVSPGHPASASFTRPTDPGTVLEQVAPIWVDQPVRGAAVTAGAPLTVNGVASVFEATVEWELLRNGQRVDNGVTTASEAAPARGTYSFTTRKSLVTGSYVVRVFASSAKDGSTIAEQLVPVTAR